MWITTAELAILLILSVVSDIKTHKIKNTITIPFAVLGVVTNTLQNGLPGLNASLLGMFAPVMLLFILYALKMLGAGDIKLLAATGAIIGIRYSISCIAYSFLFGGLIALILVLVRKNSYERFKHLITYMKCCFLSHRLLQYEYCTIKPCNSTFHFTYAIIPGTFFQLALMYANHRW